MPENYSDRNDIPLNEESIVFDGGHTPKLSRKIFDGNLPEKNQVLVQTESQEKLTVFSRFSIDQLVNYSQNAEKMSTILDYLVQEFRQFSDPTDMLDIWSRAANDPNNKNRVEVGLDQVERDIDHMSHLIRASEAYINGVEQLITQDKDQELLSRWDDLATELGRVSEYIMSNYLEKITEIEEKLDSA